MAKSPRARTAPDHGSNQVLTSLRRREQPVDIGVDARRSGTFECSITQAIAAAAFFLDFDGLIVPSARSTELNLVIFTEKLEIGDRLKVQASEPVDWSAWRSQHRVRFRRNG